ncbi:MAG TPA: peptidoglycan-binding domain-containing protein [Candidatus Binatia bacterium]|jgi:peptidoglycan hydrolase-like protein with peptidoglycan-binding domain
MKKSYLAAISGVAFGGAVILTVPAAWSQSGSDTAPSAGQRQDSESQMRNPPAGSSQRSGSGESGMSGMQSRSGRAAGQHWSKDKVKEIQEALKTKGFDPGAADGVIGQKTNQAIREFQKSNNLQVTGRVDEKTASALGVDASGASSATSPMGKESTSGSRGTSGLSSGKDSPSPTAPSSVREPSGRQQESGRPSGSSEEKTGVSEPADKSGSGGGAKVR